MLDIKFTVKKDGLRVVTETVFHAPPEKVYQACMDPKLIPQWWGPRNLTTKIDKMEVRVGGAWRFIQTDPAGKIFAFNGVYKEIVPNEKVVETFEFEPMRGHILTNTSTLTDLGGKTKLTVTSVYPSLEDLEGMLNSGMESGQRESMERLAELVEKE